ncbi:peroxidase-like [Thrips palmi]|uniref:Peroxidase-like n=1 Tax=Thrips palmi TaxID=161013 RepID=A0A6P8YKC4_THRPL|nr:peroxidase-like [Thrips palmi]
MAATQAKALTRAAVLLLLVCTLCVDAQWYSRRRSQQQQAQPTAQQTSSGGGNGYGSRSSNSGSSGGSSGSGSNGSSGNGSSGSGSNSSGATPASNDPTVDVSCPRSRSPSCQGVPPPFRPNDGSCHKADRVLGMSGTPYTRVRRPVYADGVHAPRVGVTRAALPSPREVVNRLHIDVDVPNPVVNHFFMNWGQLVAHDITLLDTAFPEANSGCCAESLRAANRATITCARIDIPNNDPFFRRHGVTCLGVQRSASNTCQTSWREQRNMVTHYLDASHVYGSDPTKARNLRANQGGLLRFRTINGEQHLPADPQGDLFAGDIRVVVTAMLSAVHTTLLREHNRIARTLAGLNPHWDDERLYQEARRVVIAQWQQITYRDWLPWLIGHDAVARNNLRPAQSGYSQAYSAQTDPRTANDFASAAFRSFHSLIQNNIWLGRSGRQAGTVVDTPAAIVLQNNMVQAVVEGMLYQPSQEQDQYMADQIKNRMFANGAAFGGDLISTDIIRGREHGLPSYNDYRQTCGLRRATSWNGFSDLISARNIQLLQTLYAHPDDVDYYVGGLLERRFDTSNTATITSPVFQCVVVDQFRRYKEGDPYFYDLASSPRPFTPAQLQEIRKQTASKLMCDNIRGLNTVPRNAFLKIGVQGNSEVQCSQLPGMDFTPWQENRSGSQQGSQQSSQQRQSSQRQTSGTNSQQRQSSQQRNAQRGWWG